MQQASLHDFARWSPITRVTKFCQMIKYDKTYGLANFQQCQ